MTLRTRLERAERLATMQAASPSHGDHGWRKLEAMIVESQAAAEAGDQVAVYRLSGIAAALAKAERARTDRAPDVEAAAHLEALAAMYYEAADLPDKAERDAMRGGRR